MGQNLVNIRLFDLLVGAAIDQYAVLSTGVNLDYGMSLLDLAWPDQGSVNIILI